MKTERKEYAEAERYYREAIADHEEAERKDTSLSLMVRLVLQKLRQKLENLQSITDSIAKT